MAIILKPTQAESIPFDQLGQTQPTQGRLLNQPTQTQPVKEPGFIKSLLSPLVKVGVQAYATGRETVRATAKLGTLAAAAPEDRESVVRELQEAEKTEKQTVKVPGYGEVMPIGLSGESTGEVIKKSAGLGAELASYGMGAVGAGKTIVGRTLLQGVAPGVTAGVGTALQEDKTLGQTALQGLTGGVLGAGAFGLTKALQPVLSAVQKVTSPIAKQQKLAVTSAIDKAFPAKEVTKKLETDNAMETVFRTINTLKPKFTDEVGEEVVGSPQTRFQVLQAITPIKQNIFNAYDEIAKTAGKTYKFNPQEVIKTEQGKKSLSSTFRGIATSKSRSKEVRDAAREIAGTIDGLKGSNVS